MEGWEFFSDPINRNPHTLRILAPRSMGVLSAVMRLLAKGVCTKTQAAPCQTRDFTPVWQAHAKRQANARDPAKGRSVASNMRPNAGPKVAPAATRLRHQRRSQRPTTQPLTRSTACNLTIVLAPRPTSRPSSRPWAWPQKTMADFIGP